MAAICWLSCLAVADGVELRASCGSRAIVRTVSALPADDAPAIEEQNQTVILHETPFVQPAMVPQAAVYGSDCGPACTSGHTSCLPPAMHAIEGWAEFEYLVWWRSGRWFPPLVTTQPNSGVLPDATVLFGGQNISEQARAGGRLDVGVWLDACRTLGLGGHYLAVGEAPIEYAVNSNELGFFARPFTDVSTDPATSTALPVANDAADLPTTGNLLLRSNSEVQAGDIFVRWVLRRSCCTQLDLLVGYQFSRLDEDLAIDTFTLTDLDIGAFETVSVSDVFDTHNEYHAAHFGLQGEYRRCRWGLDVSTRFGFGNMRQRVTIRGASTFTDVTGDVDSRASGLLAQAATNSGVHSQDKFSFMNDTGIKLNYYARERLKLSIGYSLMYWSSVVRPGDHIDLGIDGDLLDPIPPDDATRPAFAFNPTDFSLHGLNLGIEFSF